MEKWLHNICPIMGVEHNSILSKQGDITIVFEADLPEIFTLSDNDYEAFHNAWLKAIKVLPKHSIFHKQDWFTEIKYEPDFNKENSFLSHSSERHFNERPFLDHRSYLMITKKQKGRKESSSSFSSLLRKSIVPAETLKPQVLQEFSDSCSQFKRILEDSGFVKLKRLTDGSLISGERKAGLIEK